MLPPLLAILVPTVLACNPQAPQSGGGLTKSVSLSFDVAPPVAWTIPDSPAAVAGGQSTDESGALNKIKSDIQQAAALVLAEYNYPRDQIICTASPHNYYQGPLAAATTCDAGGELLVVNGVVSYMCVDAASSNNATVTTTPDTLTETSVSTETSVGTTDSTTGGSNAAPDIPKVAVHMAIDVVCSSKSEAAKYLWSIFVTKLQDRLESKNVFFYEELSFN